MTDLRTAAQQALEALEATSSYDIPAPRLRRRSAITALRAALAEPVAWTGYDLEGMVEAFSQVIEAHHSSKHPFHNPIDMDAKMALRILRGFIPAMKAYATPPQRPAAPIIQPEMLEAHNNNDMDKYISAITLNGEVWRLTQTNNELRLEAKDCFIEGMTDQTKIIGGLTIGKARRAELHSLLEQWLETVINYKLNEKNA